MAEREYVDRVSLQITVCTCQVVLLDVDQKNLERGMSAPRQENPHITAPNPCRRPSFLRDRIIQCQKPIIIYIYNINITFDICDGFKIGGVLKRIVSNKAAVPCITFNRLAQQVAAMVLAFGPKHTEKSCLTNRSQVIKKNYARSVERKSKSQAGPLLESFF